MDGMSGVNGRAAIVTYSDLASWIAESSVITSDIIGKKVVVNKFWSSTKGYSIKR